MSLTLTPLGGPTVLLELAGVRLLVDPTFDAAQEYPVGSRTLTKTADAVWSPEQVGAVHAVLLSHDQHPTTSTTAGGPLPLLRRSRSRRRSPPPAWAAPPSGSSRGSGTTSAPSSSRPSRHSTGRTAPST